MALAKKILRTPLRILIALFLAGILMQILNLPYANEVLLASFFGIGILYSIRFFKKRDKRFVDYVKLVLVIFWTVNGIFRIMEFPYTIVFQVVIAVSFLTWFFLEGTAYFLDEDRRTKNSSYQILWNFALVFGTLGIISGSLLRILHWEYSIHLLSLGITVVAAYILKDVFVPETSSGDHQSNEEFQL